MEPQEQERTPSFELPSTQHQELAGLNVPEQQIDARNEKQGNIAVEHASVQQSAPPQAVNLRSAVGQQATAIADDTSAAAAYSSAPVVAYDTDLIEKEWVEKAKEIVARTSHDPHLQNKEMNKFKADYLKKRYNKEIKLNED